MRHASGNWQHFFSNLYARTMANVKIVCDFHLIDAYEHKLISGVRLSVCTHRIGWHLSIGRRYAHWGQRKEEEEEETNKNAATEPISPSIKIHRWQLMKMSENKISFKYTYFRFLRCSFIHLNVKLFNYMWLKTKFTSSRIPARDLGKWKN